MRGGGGQEEQLTFYDVDTLPLRRVLLRVVGGGEVAPVGFFDPGPTLPSGGHTRVVLHWGGGRGRRLIRAAASSGRHRAGDAA